MENTGTFNHGIVIQERKLVDIDGVKKLESFDQREFLVDTNMGYVHIIGQGLSLGKMDIDNGMMSIKGTIDSVTYIGKTKDTAKEGFFKKLFK